ncbi:hypothetical protein H0H93_009747 [Arthromyces matolae]|nr:hypothetical protein H0H93_009747 [Arthromyces matolae]
MSQSSRSSMTLDTHNPIQPTASALPSDSAVTPVAEVVRPDIEHMPVENDPRTWSPLRKNLSLFMISSASMIAGLAGSIQNPAVEEMQTSLPATSSQFSWSVSAFILVQGLMPLVWCAISEVKGRKLVYVISLALFTVGSIVVAVSPDIGLVIGFRCAQAAGSSAVISIGAATLADMYEPAERGAKMGIYYTAPLLGPVRRMFVFIGWTYASTLAYIVDSNTGRSSSAVATNSAFRGLSAFVAVEIAVPLQDGLGDGWTYTIWAGLVSLAGLLIILVAYRGQSWRTKAEEREGLRMSKDVFSGHLGHLSPTQQENFEVFKVNLLKANLYSAPAGEGHTASHDDSTLLRFLRARGFSVNPAQKQFSDAEKWRNEHDVGNLYTTFDPVEFEAAKRFYPRWTGRRDKNGLPLYVYRLASLEPLQKDLDAVPPQRRYQRIIALYEFMVRFAFPLCSHLPHPNSTTPITSTTTIIDLEHVSIGSMWHLRSHLAEASRLATANYPETLNTVAIVNSPPFFSTIWGWIKGWFDEGTRRKIHVLGKDPGPTLRDLIHAHDLPKPYGGDLEWKFDDEPNLDDDAKAALGGATPKGPVIFVDGAAIKPT